MNKTHWSKKHQKYTKEEWINLPSIFAEEVVEYFPTKGKLLELGAGQGQDSRYFDSKGFLVTSTDNEYDALKINHQKSNPATSLVVEELDLTKLFPYKDESFDIVYSHLALHYFDDTMTKSIFQEIKRVLKPDGIVAVLVNSTSDPEFGKGKKIEVSYYLYEGTQKRYFSPQSLKVYIHDFETIILDDKGETYKDCAKGVHNLIRFIGRKK